jgi:hypothetical protein
MIIIVTHSIKLQTVVRRKLTHVDVMINNLCVSLYSYTPELCGH